MNNANRMYAVRTSASQPDARTPGHTSGLWSYYKAVLGLGILLLLLTIPATQTAQAGGGGSLIGIISDASEARAGIDGLTVTLIDDDDQPLVVTTDPRGRFEFLDLDPGNYMLVTHGAGYQDARDPKIQIRKGRSKTIRMLIAKGSTVRVLEDVEDTFARVARPLPLADRP